MTIIENRTAKRLLAHYYNELESIPKSTKLEDEPEVHAKDITIHSIQTTDEGLLVTELTHIHRPLLRYRVTHNKKTKVTVVDIYTLEKTVTIEKGQIANGQVTKV